MTSVAPVILDVVDVATADDRVVLSVRLLQGTPAVGMVFHAQDAKDSWRLHGISFGPPPGTASDVWVVAAAPLGNDLPRNGCRYEGPDDPDSTAFPG